MATYKFLIEVITSNVPEDYDDVIVEQLRDEELESANPGQLFYENARGDEKEVEIKEWNVTQVYD